MSLSKFLERNLRQDCVLWRQTGVDYTGQPLFDAPVELKCRIEIRKAVIRRPDGSEMEVNGNVTLLVEASPGDFIKECKLEDLADSNESPKQLEGAWEIKAYDDIPSLRLDARAHRVYI